MVFTPSWDILEKLGFKKAVSTIQNYQALDISKIMGGTRGTTIYDDALKKLKTGRGRLPLSTMEFLTASTVPIFCFVGFLSGRFHLAWWLPLCFLLASLRLLWLFRAASYAWSAAFVSVERWTPCAWTQVSPGGDERHIQQCFRIGFKTVREKQKKL